jgi:hypothetical protein
VALPAIFLRHRGARFVGLSPPWLKYMCWFGLLVRICFHFDLGFCVAL